MTHLTWRALKAQTSGGGGIKLKHDDTQLNTCYVDINYGIIKGDIHGVMTLCDRVCFPCVSSFNPDESARVSSRQTGHRRSDVRPEKNNVNDTVGVS